MRRFTRRQNNSSIDIFNCKSCTLLQISKMLSMFIVTRVRLTRNTYDDIDPAVSTLGQMPPMSPDATMTTFCFAIGRDLTHHAGSKGRSSCIPHEYPLFTWHQALTSTWRFADVNIALWEMPLLSWYLTLDSQYQRHRGNEHTRSPGPSRTRIKPTNEAL